RGLWQPAGTGAGADRGELQEAVAGDEVASTFLSRHSAVVPQPCRPCTFYSLLSAIGVAIAGPRDGSIEATGNGGIGCVVAADGERFFVCRPGARVSGGK